MRAASPVPIAVGEQIGSVPDAVRLVRDGGVDLLRLHTSAIGGLTPTRKLVALCELLGVRTAFHSPGDVSPVGVAANLAVDVSTPAFGYQESHTYNDATHEVFPGTPVVREGHLYAVPRAGLGRRPRREGRGGLPAGQVPASSAGRRASAVPTAASTRRDPQYKPPPLSVMAT